MADFEQLKERISILDVAKHLGISLKQYGQQYRCKCPICNEGNDRSCVITEGKGFYCFAKCRKGGDQIELASRLWKVSAKDAAERLAAELHIGFSVREPMHELDYLDPTKAQPFAAADARAVGIGYAPRGILRGTIAIPLPLSVAILRGFFIGCPQMISRDKPLRYRYPIADIRYKVVQ